MKYLAMTSLILSLALVSFILFPRTGLAQHSEHSVITIPNAADFTIDGKGSAKQWNRTDWITIPQRETTKRESKNKVPAPTNIKPLEKLSTRAKLLYSDTGIYFLFQCEDRILQATMEEDFKQLWWEDVVEIFLWPDENDGTYFEYQLSPLNYELIIRIGRDDRGRSSWQPFSYGDDKRTRHETSVEGGERKSGESITQWTAEVYMPYQLLHPANNFPPESGTRWRVNLYRFDYDTGDRTRWEWQPVNGANHDIEKFGTLLFE